MSSRPKHRSRAQDARGAPEEREWTSGPVVGTIVSYEHGEIRVKSPVSGRAPLAARALMSIDDAALQRAARDESEALLLFEDGNPAKPVLVGLLRSRAPLVESLLAGPLPDFEKVARVDGKRVYVEGKDEVVLQCGKASLTLQRDGKVVLRGVNVVSHADQVNKLRGGKVQVN